MVDREPMAITTRGFRIGNDSGVQDRDLELLRPSLGLGGTTLLPYTEGAVFDMPLGESQVNCPSDMIAFGDAILEAWREENIELTGGLLTLSPGLRWTTEDRWGTWPSAKDMDMSRVLRKRHGGRWTFVFCDGHSEILRKEALFDHGRDDVLQRWNRDHLPHRDQLNFFK
jgi:prepilin-type processing-associated H-X9-DG protein